MKDFFADDLPPQKKRKPRKKNTVKKSKKELTCENCGLDKQCISPHMPATGKGEKKILVICEAPGKTEDEENIQLVGRAGKLLRKCLEEIDLDLDLDFWKTNAIICRPPKNRTPTAREINICRKHLFETINKYNPKVIIPMGKAALDSLLGLRIVGRIKNVNFSDWVGEIIPDQELKKWICPVYHPSYILRNEWDIVLKREWKKSIKKAVSIVDAPFYTHNYEKDIITTQDKNKAIEWIKKAIAFMKKKIFNEVTFDYETTGIKPHREGHRIVCCSFSDGITGYAFPFFDDKEFRREWRKLVGSSKRGCVAQNARFEGMWTETKAGFSIKNWEWDTMIGQSILDNRKTTKLKFWVYVKFGVLSYDDEVDNYISKIKKGEDIKSNNSFNCIEEAPVEELLKYNALDSLFTHKIYESQRIHIKGYLKNGFDLFMEGFQRLLKAQQNGIKIDLKVMQESKTKIIKKLNVIRKKIMTDKVLNRWDGENTFDFNSSKQISHLLYDILKIKVTKETAKGNASVDQSALEKIDIPIVKNILRYRKWYKVLNTYIAQYEREHVNGYLHPFFNLGTSGSGRGVKTYRSSSNSPNFQNIPKRDKQVKKIIRELIISREGNRLIEYDFKGMEVSLAACYNKDPNLIAYLEDDTADMHKDSAADLFLKQDIDKIERFIAKNDFVFAEFYGDYYEPIAVNLWADLPSYTRKHLREQGIKKYRDFENHVKEVERIFWEEKFPVYAEWKKKTLKDYERKGYVKLYSGFKCRGPMRKNEVINYKIQGTAFHCLLWTFNNVAREVEKFDNSFLIGQIHDAIASDVHPEEEKELDYLVWYYGTQKIREHWDWIIVPLKIEKERSEINGNWAEMSDMGYLEGGK